MPPLSTDYTLEIMLLGGFEARLNGGPITGISYNKMRALFAYLAVEREQDHSREALADLLWSGFDTTTARDNLRRALSNLRKALETPSGANIFSADKHTIRFLPNVYIDAVDFSNPPSAFPEDADVLSHEERLISLYRGEFLAGLSFSDSPDFEDWLQIKRESLHRRALALLEKLSGHHAQTNDYSKALQFALRHTELEPWDENAHRRVMHLYALNGQNSAAIHQYEICRLLLEKDLDVSPSEETRHLYEQIRHGKFKRRSTDRVAPEPVSVREPSSATERRKADRRKANNNELSKVTPSELRRVSVLYCDLITVAIDDPDEIMALLRPTQARCVKIIEKFSGHIMQTHGGGLLAYFGYPQAHEYAAHRAVQAALAAVLETGRDIKVRASVHTGLVIADSATSMPDTTGITSKLAIQLRQSVEFGKVAISQDTHRIVAGYFDCVSLGFQLWPEFPRPMEIFEVFQENRAHTRLDAAPQLTPLVGRKAELARLLALWRQTVSGVNQAALILGEAGIGKSRLIHALKEQLADIDHKICVLMCFPEFSQSPYHPLIAMIETEMGFTAHDTQETKLDKLIKHIEANFPSSINETLSVFAQLLSLPIAGDNPVRDFSPQKQKEQTFAVLLNAVKTIAAQQPLWLIVENLHWIDPSTLELLTLFVEQQHQSAIFIAFTARPEFVLPWNNNRVTTLALNPLAEDEVNRMIASITEEIPPATVRSIIERADGVPLFVEEIAKIAMQDNQASIPPTLHDILAARIDTMGVAKHTAQLAATLGREFDWNLVQKISDYDAVALKQNLNALQEAGLIFKVNDSTFQFKHALIQEAAYQSQTKSDLKAAHQRIAETLLRDFPDTVAAKPELLARHLSSGGKAQQAIEYWIKAGQKAARHSANLEAMEHFNAGLQLLTGLPSEQDRNKIEFNILVNLCLVLYALKGYGSEEAKQINARLADLSDIVGASPDLFQAKWSHAMNIIANAGSREVSGAVSQLLIMAENDPLKRQAAHYIAAKSAFWLGKFELTRIHAEQGVAIYDRSQFPMLLEQFGEDLSVSSGSYLFWSLYFLGYPDQAQHVLQKVVKQARGLGHPHTLCLALCTGALLYRALNNYAQALSMSAEAIAISQQYGFPVWLAVGKLTHGWARVMLGQEEGILELKSSIAGMRTAIGGISVVFLSALIEAYLYLKLPHSALDLIDKALSETETTGDQHFTAELYRLKGECLLAVSESHSNQAMTCFQQAIAIARQQKAKSLQLRATVSLARLWIYQGNSIEARQVLKEIYRQFTEGFDTPDLQQAADLIRNG
jgi:predicted ATPase/DNA-binding SARP family transcriptional activator